MLISWIAWVRSLYMTRVQVEGDFLGCVFGPKRSTYTRVNTVIGKRGFVFFCRDVSSFVVTIVGHRKMPFKS